MSPLSYQTQTTSPAYRYQQTPWTRRITYLLVLLFLISCRSGQGIGELETRSPDSYVSTAVALTVQAGMAAQPTAPQTTTTIQQIKTQEITASTTNPPVTSTGTSAVLSGPSPTPSRSPARTATLTPTPLPPISAIQILDPGPASKVVSPLEVSLYLKTGERGTVIIELLGENSRLLVRKVMNLEPERRLKVSTELDFEIPAVAEAARLVVRTEDKENRTIALNSVDLVLLSLGSNDLTPSGDQLERIIIREPSPNTLIQGGKILISGLAHSFSDEPLQISLIGEDGAQIGPSRQVSLDEPDQGLYQSFTTDLPYTVPKTTWVLLTISQNAGRIDGPVYLSSIKVLLSP